MEQLTKESLAEPVIEKRQPAKAYAAREAAGPLSPWNFERRLPGPHDVQADILYCGVCHTDIHFIRNDWGMSIYPLVPGHEIVGKVSAVGNHVRKFKVGDLVGIGCLVDSCRECDSCRDGLEQYCTGGFVLTYSDYEKDGKSITYGGYSNRIVVDEHFVLKISEKLPLERVAPLLCAGITTYSPLRHWDIRPGQKVGVVGLGGLGHIAVKFAVSFGAEVTVFSTSASKAADAKRLGAHKFVVVSNKDELEKISKSFHFILDTVSGSHDYNLYLDLLRASGSMVCVGLPPEPAHIPAFGLVFNRRSFAGSLIGGIAETQEMLDYCADKNITADIELISMKDINTAYLRMEKNDVKYRFVIDMSTL